MKSLMIKLDTISDVKNFVNTFPASFFSFKFTIY